MMLDYDRLLAAVSPRSPYSTLSITAELAPTGGDGSKVSPPTFPPPEVRDGRQPRRTGPYLIDTRWIDSKETEVVVLDRHASQAHRVQVSLMDANDDGLVDLPAFELHQVIDTAAGQRKLRLTSFEFPHRYADAYLRDSIIDGIKFDKTDVGKRLRLATPRKAESLYELDPNTLAFGAWDSHRKGRQPKFSRIYDSTIIGLNPLVGVSAAVRLDPLNLIGSQKKADDDWIFVAPDEAGGKKAKGNRLSEVGHGHAPASDAPGQVSITSARRQCVIHLPALRNLRFDASPEATNAARATLAAYALMGDRLAFDHPSIFLRSGCDLTKRSETMALERPDGTLDTFELHVDDAVALFTEARHHASDLGLPMSTEHIRLTPNEQLAKAIEYAFNRGAKQESE